jgi:hypothetical protein
MGSFDREITNFVIRLKEKNWKKCQGWSPQSNINEDIDISKMGESDMPF